jgi:enamine deaminase RidA (YjgF/YER057c/UK114 family)
MTPEQRLASMDIVLPPAPIPAGQYRPARLVGNMLYLSGQGPRDASGSFLTGRLGANVSVDEGYAAARNAGLQLLSAAKVILEDLSRVETIVKVFGMVNAEADFIDHARVVNGCSDLLIEIFGEAGCHTRSVAGMGSLPLGMVVEIEAIFSVKSQ